MPQLSCDLYGKEAVVKSPAKAERDLMAATLTRILRQLFDAGFEATLGIEDQVTMALATIAKLRVGIQHVLDDCESHNALNSLYGIKSLRNLLKGTQ